MTASAIREQDWRHVLAEGNRPHGLCMWNGSVALHDESTDEDGRQAREHKSLTHD
jgi:hypothetical protein